MHIIDNTYTIQPWEIQLADAYHSSAFNSAEAAHLVREFPAIMQAGNAEMLRRLGVLVAAPIDMIPPILRPHMIAALRERHMIMPSGREISLKMQSCLERALIQARLHFLRTPGAEKGFTLASIQYMAELTRRRDEALQHLRNLQSDALSPLGAIEWCERLVTKFTVQEIAGPYLGFHAQQVREIRDMLVRFDPSVGPVLEAAADFLALGENVTANAAVAVRQHVPGFARTTPQTYQDVMSVMPMIGQARRARR